MSKTLRVTLTKTEAASEYGQRLLLQIMTMSHDGELTIHEVRALYELVVTGPAHMNAVPFLRTLLHTALLDDNLDDMEAYSIRRALERVVPKALRMQLSELLSRIGLPSADDDDELQPAWHEDPMTARQANFIRKLGGEVVSGMTKGEASRLIDRLLESRPSSPRQQMIVRFLGFPELALRSKDEIGEFLDDVFLKFPELEDAWLRYKREVGDDGSMNDPSLVPIGAVKDYLRKPPLITSHDAATTMASGASPSQVEVPKPAPSTVKIPVHARVHQEPQSLLSGQTGGVSNKVWLIVVFCIGASVAVLVVVMAIR